MSESPLHAGGSDPAVRIAGRLLVGLGCALAAATVWTFADSFVDDAYISLRYARNWLDGLGLVFNPGEYVEGITNLGQVVAIAALGWLGIDLTFAARMLGVAGALAAVSLGPRVLLPDPQEHLERAIARLLLLANFAFVYMAVTGLETILYVGLVCAACHTFTRHDRHMDWATGLLVAALCTVRPDGLLIGAVLAGFAGVRWGPRGLLRSPGLWIWLAGFAALELFRFWYYGQWVPNTALVKGPGGSGAPLDLPWYGAIGDDIVEMLAQTGGATSLLFALVAIVYHRHRDAIHLAVSICGAAFLFEAYAGGDWMLNYRFLLPALPFYLSLVAIGMVTCLRALLALDGAPRRLLPLAGALVLIVIAVNCWSFGLEFLQRSNQYPNSYMTSHRMRAAARWIGENYAEPEQLQVSSIGALGYFSNLVIIDTLGLTDRTIARVGADPAAKAAYLAKRQPELVVLVGKDARPVENDMALHGQMYRYVRSFNMGDSHWWLFEAAGS